MFAGRSDKLWGVKRSILKNGNLKSVAHTRQVCLFCKRGIITLSVAALLESSLGAFPAVRTFLLVMVPAFVFSLESRLGWQRWLGT